MEDNMDKHLKQSLDEFSFQPKFSSFDEVLRKMEKRKRRSIFLWFVLPGIFITAGALMLLSGSYLDKDTLQSNTEIFTKINSKQQSTQNIQGQIKKQPAENSIHQKKVLSDEKNLNDKLETKFPKDKDQTLKQNTSRNNDNGISAHPLVKVSFPASNDLIKNSSVVEELPELEPEKLEMVSAFIPVNNSVIPDLSPSFNEEKVVHLKNDSVTNPKKSLRFLIGIDFDPQLNSYLLTKNRNNDGRFVMNSSESFSKAYLENKKRQNTIRYNYNAGIRAGFVIHEKWEILLGFGFQRFKEKEKIYDLVNNVGPFSNSTPQSFTAGNISGTQIGNTYANTLRYIYYSLEASKYFSWKKFTKMKMGVGMHANNIRSSNMVIVENADAYSYLSTRSTPLNEWMYSVNLKLGFIHDLSNKIQFQFCPGIFSGINSVFNKTYVIDQRVYGFNLECLLIFKIH